MVGEPQRSPHYTAIGLVGEALRAALGAGWLVRPHGPLALDEESEPEPDISLVPGTWRDYVAAHPARPVLVVEVSLSRLTFDREHKGSLYARAGLADYWIVNLVDGVLAIYREPVVDHASPFGWRYASIQRLGADAAVSPLAVPTARVRVNDLLP